MLRSIINTFTESDEKKDLYFYDNKIISPKDAKNTEFIEKLRTSGLRPTKQRLKICEVLFDRDSYLL